MSSDIWGLEEASRAFRRDSSDRPDLRQTSLKDSIGILSNNLEPQATGARLAVSHAVDQLSVYAESLTGPDADPAKRAVQSLADALLRADPSELDTLTKIRQFAESVFNRQPLQHIAEQAASRSAPPPHKLENPFQAKVPRIEPRSQPFNQTLRERPGESHLGIPEEDAGIGGVSVEI